MSESVEKVACDLGPMHGMASTYVRQDGTRCCDFCGHPVAQAALSAIPAQGDVVGATEETAWLIERDDIATIESRNRTCLHYYAEHRPGRHYWTPDHMQARRFPDEESARKEANGDPLLRVAEHMWVAKPAGPQIDEDWLTETIDDSLDMDWTGRVAARLILSRLGVTRLYARPPAAQSALTAAHARIAELEARGDALAGADEDEIRGLEQTLGALEGRHGNGWINITMEERRIFTRLLRQALTAWESSR